MAGSAVNPLSVGGWRLQAPVTPSWAGLDDPVERRDATVVCLSKLPPFHPAALKLLNISSESTSAMMDFELAFQSDPALAADLLLVANSPLFGNRAEVATIRRALTHLGLERVRDLATIIAIGYFVRNQPRTGHIRDIWSHGIATALIADNLGRLSGLPDLYTAGLTHDLGRLGFLLSMGPRYEVGITREFADMSEANQLEKDLFGMDHCQAGGVVGRRWGFPAFLHECMTHHHENQSGQPARPGQSLALVRTTCQLADSLGFSEVRQRGQPPPLVLPKALENHAALAPDKLRNEILQQIRVMGG
jgi:HD-like signal output (HDOD) protein